LYQSERYGNVTYALPVNVSGNYEVTLKFAEVYHSAVGARTFDVKAEGVTIISALDIYQAAGGKNKAYDVVKTVNVTDGELTLQFVTIKDNAKVSAILVKESAQLKSAPVANGHGFKFKAYPNPASGFLTVKSDFTGDTQVTISNINGQIVVSSQYKGSFNDNLNISSLSPGMYMVKTISGDKIEVTKLIVK